MSEVGIDKQNYHRQTQNYYIYDNTYNTMNKSSSNHKTNRLPSVTKDPLPKHLILKNKNSNKHIPIKLPRYQLSPKYTSPNIQDEDSQYSNQQIGQSLEESLDVKKIDNKKITKNSIEVIKTNKYHADAQTRQAARASNAPQSEKYYTKTQAKGSNKSSEQGLITPLLIKNMNINGILNKILKLEKNRAVQKHRNHSLNSYGDLPHGVIDNMDTKEKKERQDKIMSQRNKYLRYKTNVSMSKNNVQRGKSSKGQSISKSPNSAYQEEELIEKQIELLNQRYIIMKNAGNIDSGTLQINLPKRQSKRNLTPSNPDPLLYDKTLEDFQKSIKKNREQIHNQITHNLSLRRNKHYKMRNKTETPNQVQQGVQLLRSHKRSQRKQESKSQESYKERRSRESQKRQKSASSSNKKSGKIVPMKQRNEIRKQYINKNRNLTDFQSYKGDLNIFNEINRIILQKAEANQENLYHSPSNYKHFHKKLDQLTYKIKQLSPEKSTTQIRQEAQEQLSRDFGIPEPKVVNQEKEQYILKNEENYSEWRRVHVDKSPNNLNAKSLNLQMMRASPSKASVTYKESTYDTENSRLQNFIEKTELTLGNYLKGRNQLMNYKRNSENQEL